MAPTLEGTALPTAPLGTLTDAIEGLGQVEAPWLTIHAGRTQEVLTGAHVHKAARGWAEALRKAGVGPGDRVLVWLPNDARFVGAFFGALWLGAVPVPLAWPFTFGDRGRRFALLKPLVDAADAKALATCSSASSLVDETLPCVTGPDTPTTSPPFPISPEDPAFLQFTSGSLGRPKGAVISHRAAVSSVVCMGLALDLGPDDVGVSWLPLFHDMGLVGALLCPLWHRFPLHLMAPGEFLLHPKRWLQRLSEAGGTIAAAPDFAYALVARRVRSTEGLDLGRWRHALNGAEPVHRSTLDAFCQRLEPTGFRPEALRPVYGLAENTLGVSFVRSDTPTPDLSWQGRCVPSVGQPLPGTEIQVWTQDGPAPKGVEGEIRVRGPSLMTAYFRDPEASQAALQGGWLHTGDLGVMRSGQLYVTGRQKDVVIRHGSKFHPYDIERVAAEAVGAPPNGAAAFAAPTAQGAEALVVVVEVRASAGDADKKVQESVMEALGIRPDRVVVVEPGAIPRTTSGKVRRQDCAAWHGGAS